VKVVAAPVKPDGGKLLFNFADYSGDQSESELTMLGAAREITCPRAVFLMS